MDAHPCLVANRNGREAEEAEDRREERARIGVKRLERQHEQLRKQSVCDWRKKRQYKKQYKIIITNQIRITSKRHKDHLS